VPVTDAGEGFVGRHSEALLQRGEVGRPLLVGDDDLAIDKCVDWKRPAGAHDFGEPWG